MDKRRGVQVLLSRVDTATDDDQWSLICDAARLLLDIDDPVRTRVNQLCDAGGFLDAAVALVGRLLPGHMWSVDGPAPNAVATILAADGTLVSPWFQKTTPGLAVLGALLQRVPVEA